jgi:uncharacterized protein
MQVLIGNKWVAALPVLEYANATRSVCLITSKGTGRWIVPRGKLNAGEDPWTGAERECFEEAGVLGQAAQTPIAMLRLKPSGRLEIPLYKLDVLEVLESWPELGMRERTWKSPIEAAAMIVDDPELVTVLNSLASSHPTR